MKQWGYDYEEYKKAQIAANRRKQGLVWVSEKNIKFLAGYAREKGIIPELVLCHGTRNGAEQKYWKRALPDSEVIGTEISPEGERYPMTMVHDFHEPTGMKADIIYTNSFDHCHDPRKCLETWADEGDWLFIEHSDCDFDSRVTEHDPFGASFEEMNSLLSEYGEVIDLLVMPEFHGGCYDQRVFVVKC